MAMVLEAHGNRIDLADLRKRFTLSLKGVNLKQLMEFAAAVNLSARAVRLEIAELGNLKLPCILHWDLNHFVVLAKVRRKGVVVLDPAVGERRLSFAELSRHFTGVALELTPNAEFKPRDERARLSLRQLTGSVQGLVPALAKTLARRSAELADRTAW